MRVHKYLVEMVNVTVKVNGKKIKDYPCMVVGKTHKEVCDPWANASAATGQSGQQSAPQFETYKGAFGTVRIPV